MTDCKLAPSRRDEAHSLVMLFNAFTLASARSLSVASVLALLQIAIQTLSREQPRLATPTDVARTLNMSLSAVVRLLNKLAEPGGPEFLVSNQSLLPGRSDAYALTDAGREFVSKLIAISRRGEQDSASLNEIATFETAKRHPHEPLHKLKQLNWNEERRELQLEQPGEAVVELISSWVTDNLGEDTDIIYRDNGMLIKFRSLNDAVWFKLRWC